MEEETGVGVRLDSVGRSRGWTGSSYESPAGRPRPGPETEEEGFWVAQV